LTDIRQRDIGFKTAVAAAASTMTPAWAVNMAAAIYFDSVRREAGEVAVFADVARALTRVADGQRK
jgi:hypothetical protein